MSANQILNTGQGAKGYFPISCFNCEIQGRMSENKAVTAINVTGNASAAAVYGGIITSSTAAAVTLTFPNGFAAALNALQGGPGYVILDQDLVCLIVNNGPNAITLATADANTTFFDAANVTVASHTTRSLHFYLTSASAPFTYVIY